MHPGANSPEVPREHQLQLPEVPTNKELVPGAESPAPLTGIQFISRSFCTYILNYLTQATTVLVK